MDFGSEQPAEDLADSRAVEDPPPPTPPPTPPPVQPSIQSSPIGVQEKNDTANVNANTIVVQKAADVGSDPSKMGSGIEGGDKAAEVIQREEADRRAALLGITNCTTASRCVPITSLA